MTFGPGGIFLIIKLKKNLRLSNSLLKLNFLLKYPQARLVISQDSQVVHEDVLSSLIEPMPTMVMPYKVGTPTNTFNLPAIVGSNDSSPMVKRSQKVGIYWTPPLMVAQGRTINFDVSLPTGISVDASLNTWQIVFILVTEEIPQSNLSQVR